MVKARLLLIDTALIVTIAACLLPIRGKTVEKSTMVQDLQQTFNKRRPRKEGIRRGGICALSPGTDALQKDYVIWSDRPLFLWQVEGNQISVQRIRVLSQADEVVWEKPLQADDQQTTYNGKTLQPGQIYSWELTYRRNSDQSQSLDVVEYRFQVMSSTQRNQISNELQGLITQLKANNATSEAIALQQAHYLADQGLLSDALQVLHTLNAPSSETRKFLQNLTNSVCSSTNSRI